MRVRYVLVLFMFISVVSCQHCGSVGSNKILIDSMVVERATKYKEYQAVQSRKEDFLSNLSKVMKLPLVPNDSDNYLRIWLWGNDEKYVIDIFDHNEIQGSNVWSFNSRFADSGEVILIHYCPTKIEM